MISLEKRNTLVGIHLREAYRLILGAHEGAARDEAEDIAREVAIDFMNANGITTPEVNDDFGVVVGDYLQTILMMALLRYKGLENVMSPEVTPPA